MSVDSKFLEFSKPFIDATKNIFETMVFSKLDPQKPNFKQDSVSRGDVTAFIGITGSVSRNGTKKEFKGMLAISWPYETYFKVASAMLSETYTSYCNEISDLGSEICNMIMGNAKRELANLGYTSNMAIPSMIEGKNHTIKYPPETTIIVVPVNSAHGQFFIEICYNEEK